MVPETLGWGGGRGSCLKTPKFLTLFDMGGHDGPPQNVFDHCAQMLRKRKLKLFTFNINL